MPWHTSSRRTISFIVRLNFLIVMYLYVVDLLRRQKLILFELHLNSKVGYMLVFKLYTLDSTSYSFEEDVCLITLLIIWHIKRLVTNIHVNYVFLG